MPGQIRMRASVDMKSRGVKAGETFDVSEEESVRLRGLGQAKRLGPVSEFKGKKADVGSGEAERPQPPARSASHVEGRAASELDPETRANASARTPGAGPARAADTAATPRTSRAGAPTKAPRVPRNRAMTADAPAPKKPGRKAGSKAGSKAGTYNRRDMRAK